MTDIETVRLLTGNTEVSDDLISFYLESTKQFILGYCNLKEIPNELKPTYLEITSLRIKANTSGSAAALGEGLKTVASISDGNQSIGYLAGGAGSKSFVSEEDFVATYGYMLDRFRKMVVNKPVGRPFGARRIDGVPHRGRW